MQCLAEISFSKVPKTFKARKAIRKTLLSFSYVVKGETTKITTKFGTARRLRCEDTSRIVNRSFGTFEKQDPRARFAKVPKLYGPFSGVTIPFLTQEWRAFNSSNLTVIFLFVTLKTC